MRRSRTGAHRCLALILGLSLCAGHASAAAPFPDLEKSWYGYQESVAYLMKKGSIEGRPDGLFHPKDTVNRAEFLTMVFRARGDAEPVAGGCFDDVASDAWYAPYVCAAKRRGIVKGYETGSRTLFKPEQPIVFAEAVKMALLAYGHEVTEGTGERWYRPYVEALDRSEILASWSYIPWEPITRERAADLIARFIRKTDDVVTPHFSPGCGAHDRQTSLSLTVGGQTRSYLLKTSAIRNRSRPSGLIVAFHGRTNSNEQVRKYFGLDRVAKNYVIAYPAGLPSANGGFTWADPADKASELRDIAFFDAIVKEIAETSCIDLDRIFVVGHSLGAWFASSVACARGGIVRGSAVVGGATTMPKCSGPTAALIINNSKDPSSPQTAAETMRDVRMSQNACEPAAQKTEPEALSCVRYTGCTQNPVVFCPHTIDRERDGTYYPHLWPPGSGEAIVKFFDGL